MERQREKENTAESKAIKRRRRNVLIVLAELLVFLLLAVTTYGVSILRSYNYEELDKNVYIASVEHDSTARVTTVVDETDEEGNVVGSSEVEVEISTGKGFRNILILGLDARANFSFNDSGVNTDVIMIASVNNATGDVKLVSVLRDTILKMEEGSTGKAYDKANSQYYTGISDTVSMINRNFGLDIDEYVLVNWYGVATCINQLGGVELTIPNAQMLSWFNGYLTETNEKTGIFAPQLPAPGTYNMTGTQAVAFCRIRYGNLNDTGRTQNQREVVGKMLGKAKDLFKAGEIGQLLTIAETALGNVKTNLTLPEILYTATEVGNYQIAGSRQFPQNYVSGKYLGNYPAKYGILDALVAKDFAGEVKALHEFLFGNTNYTPSPFIQGVSYQMQLDTAGK